MTYRSRWLDVLRAVAISLVVLRHGVGAPSSGPVQAGSEWLHNLALNGWLGVDLFFVLSGYLLGSQIVRSTTEQHAFSRKRFLIRRAARTLPAYWFMLFVLWAGTLAAPLATGGVGDPWALAIHLVFLNDYFGPPLLVTFWSLATEEKFYLLMAVFVPWLALQKPARAALSLCALAAMIAGIRFIYFNLDPEQQYAAFFWRYRAPFHFAVDGLVLGLAAALIRTRLKRALRFRVGLTAAVGATALLVARPWLQPGDLQFALIAWPAFVIFCALMVLSTEAADGTIGCAAWTRPFGWIAKLSYSLYLVHLPTAIVTKAWLPCTENPVAGAAIFWIGYLCTSLLLAWLLHVTVERPGMKLGRRLAAHHP